MVTADQAIFVGQGSAEWAATAQGVGSLLAVLVGVAGFIFVLQQIRNLRAALQSEANSKIYAEDAAIMTVIVDKRLRGYFFEEVEIERGTVDYDAVLVVAHMMLCHFEHVLLQLENLPKFVRQGWVDYSRFIYRRSPAVRTTYLEYRKANVFVEEMDDMLKGSGPFVGPVLERKALWRWG